MRTLFIAAAMFALWPQAASAQEIAAFECANNQIGEDFGISLVESALADVDLGDPPEDLSPVIDEILADCMAQTNTPDSDSEPLSFMLVGTSMREEAALRLDEEGVNYAWTTAVLDSALNGWRGEIDPFLESVFPRLEPGLAENFDPDDPYFLWKITVWSAYVTGYATAEIGRKRLIGE